ncbi:MAG: alpha/beta fold hydrolase [Nitrospirae bacterium]|nr:alpha/beta fold hydrolase [Nitrospirota bacterium]
MNLSLAAGFAAALIAGPSDLKEDLRASVLTQMKEAALRPLDAKTVLVKEARDTRQYEVSYLGGDGVRVFGSLHKPLGVEGVPLVLLVHDFGEGRLEEFAKDLARAGFGALAIDLRGHGHSSGDAEVITKGWMRESIRGTPRQPSLQSAVDVAQGIRLLREETPAVFAAGIGLGANLVWIASQSQPVRGVALAGPLFCGETVDLILSGRASGSRAVQDLAGEEADTIRWFTGFFQLDRYPQRVPILLAEAVTDAITPRRCIQRWIAGIPRTVPVEIVPLAHRGQFVSGEWTKAMVGWFEKILSGGRPTKKKK